jgi:hypothetical protein
MTLCEPQTLETKYTQRGSYTVNKPAFLGYNSKYDKYYVSRVCTHS